MSLYSGRNFFGFVLIPAPRVPGIAADGSQPDFPMPLTPEDVSRIAHLARLELSPAEGTAMQTQLNEFFGNPEARSPRAKDFLSKILQH